MSERSLTSSQTVGPFFAPALLLHDAHRNVLVGQETLGTRIRIEGRVFDGDALPVPDALIEIWQANASGHYNHSGAQRKGIPNASFFGFGRSGTDGHGRFWFETIKPGSILYTKQQMQAPHISVTIFARGLLNHLVTRLYFADEPSNAFDPILLRVPEHRRATLLAQHEPRGATTAYHFDIVLQGGNETVFFNV